MTKHSSPFPSNLHSFVRLAWERHTGSFARLRRKASGVGLHAEHASQDQLDFFGSVATRHSLDLRVSSLESLASFGFRHSTFILHPLCLALLLSTLSACSSGGPEPTYPVQGVVRVEGEPLKGGSILFEPVEAGPSGKHHSARGTIDSTGRYTLSTFGEHDGAVAGRHHVMVFEKEEQLSDDPNLVRYTIIPDAYHTPQTTPLVVEVKPEANEIDVPIEKE